MTHIVTWFLLFYVVDQSSTVSLIFSTFSSKRRSKRLDIECSLNKFFFRYFLDDSKQIKYHIVIEYFFGDKPLETFSHDRSPFLYKKEDTYGDINLTRWSFANLLALIFYLIIVICSLKFISKIYETNRLNI